MNCANERKIKMYSRMSQCDNRNMIFSVSYYLIEVQTKWRNWKLIGKKRICFRKRLKLEMSKLYNSANRSKLGSFFSASNYSCPVFFVAQIKFVTSTVQPPPFTWNDGAKRKSKKNKIKNWKVEGAPSLRFLTSNYIHLLLYYYTWVDLGLNNLIAARILWFYLFTVDSFVHRAQHEKCMGTTTMAFSVVPTLVNLFISINIYFCIARINNNIINENLP